MKQKKIFSFLLILLLLLAACNAAGGEPQVAPAENEEVGETESVESEEAEETAVTSSSSEPNGPHPTPYPASRYDDLEIIALLPRDGIPAIDNPEFLSVEEADEKYDPDELIIGVEFNGDARAYSIPLLSNHEIVNDTVGGEKIAVTW